MPLEFQRTLSGYMWFAQMSQRPESLPSAFSRIREETIDGGLEAVDVPGDLYNEIRRIRNRIGKVEIASFSVPDIPPWKIPPVRVCKFSDLGKKDNPPEVLKARFLEHMDRHRNVIEVFTDGSKTEEGVGAAAWIPRFNQVNTRAISQKFSIFAAELIAIICALQFISYRPNIAETFVIYSDSLSALQAVLRYNSKNPHVQEIQQWLYRLHSRKKEVSFCWSPGHVGIGGNEHVDKLAKQSISGPVIEHAMNYKELRPLVRKIVCEDWQKKWETDPAERDNKLRRIKPKLGVWHSSFQSDREWEVILCRLRMGHTRLTHSHLMDRSPAPDCFFCFNAVDNVHEPLSVKHILVECMSLENLRLKCFPKLRGKTPEERLALLLDDNLDGTNLKNYLKDLNIYFKI